MDMNRQCCWKPHITVICLLLVRSSAFTRVGLAFPPEDGTGTPNATDRVWEPTPNPGGNRSDWCDRSREFLDAVKEDTTAFYLSPHRLLGLGIAFGAGGVMANTDLDQHLQNWVQQHVRTGSGDEAAKVAKAFGNAAYVFPVAVAATLAGDIFRPHDDSSLIGVWGARVSRAYLVGGPPLLLTQWLTGGDRPTDGDSRWRPFQHDHGLSCHAFIGAVPFLTLGRMSKDNGVARYGLYALSTLPALSRVNDNAHFPSQAFLGWFLAWEATGAVLQTSKNHPQIALAPVTMHDGYGLGLEIQW
jgi:hypothetical protein